MLIFLSFHRLIGGGFTISAWNAVAEALAGSELRSGGDVKGAEECRSAYSRVRPLTLLLNRRSSNPV